jgi:peptidyl-prolyl cis-trans isomerase B (cyclophilin B)
MVTFHTNHGDIVIKTFDDKAPETVKNFLDYCREGFYNNTIFHRVINGFMIQGGGFEPGMNQKETKEAIKNEANNGLKNTRGRWQWPVLRRLTLPPRSSSSTWLTTTS